jgi:hypothetical protein
MKRGFFERRGREGFAKCAEGVKRKYKMNSKINTKISKNWLLQFEIKK